MTLSSSHGVSALWGPDGADQQWTRDRGWWIVEDFQLVSQGSREPVSQGSHEPVQLRSSPRDSGEVEARGGKQVAMVTGWSVGETHGGIDVACGHQCLANVAARGKASSEGAPAEVGSAHLASTSH